MHVHIWSLTHTDSHAAGINDWTTGDADCWQYDVNRQPDPRHSAAVVFLLEVRTWVRIPALCA